MARVASECQSSGGQTACGFHCKAGFGEVHCARTPDGLCTNIEGRIVCWDPPAEVGCHPAKSKRPDCKSKRGRIACGYQCAMSETDVRCAETPYGVCTTFRDHVICWDPSPSLIHAADGKLSQPECRNSEIEAACGYHCRESYGHVTCAQSPNGRCTVDQGKLFCWDPPLPPPEHSKPCTQD